MLPRDAGVSGCCNLPIRQSKLHTPGGGSEFPKFFLDPWGG